MKSSPEGEHHEAIPLGGSVEYKDDRPRCLKSRPKIIAAVVFVALLIVIVIVLAVLLVHRQKGTTEQFSHDTIAARYAMTEKIDVVIKTAR